MTKPSASRLSASGSLRCGSAAGYGGVKAQNYEDDVSHSDFHFIGRICRRDFGCRWTIRSQRALSPFWCDEGLHFRSGFSTTKNLRFERPGPRTPPLIYRPSMRSSDYHPTAIVKVVIGSTSQGFRQPYLLRTGALTSVRYWPQSRHSTISDHCLL